MQIKCRSKQKKAKGGSKVCRKAVSWTQHFFFACCAWIIQCSGVSEGHTDMFARGSVIVYFMEQGIDNIKERKKKC